MWYYVVKNGKSVKRFKDKESAILYATNELEFDSVDDTVAVVSGTGYYVWEL